MKYIKETIIGQDAFNDLDLILQEEILGENPDGHNYLFIPDTKNLIPEKYFYLVQLP